MLLAQFISAEMCQPIVYVTAEKERRQREVKMSNYKVTHMDALKH
jgi:hypothetical protein